MLLPEAASNSLITSYVIVSEWQTFPLNLISIIVSLSLSLITSMKGNAIFSSTALPFNSIVIPVTSDEPSNLLIL